MKKKELRLALVCCGGLSLVLYMQGVIKEFLKLTRASKAYHSIDDPERRQVETFATTAAVMAENVTLRLSIFHFCRQSAGTLTCR